LGSLQNLGISPRGRAGAASRAAPARAWPAPGPRGRHPPGGPWGPLPRPARAACALRAPPRAPKCTYILSLQAKTPSLACRVYVFLIKKTYSSKKQTRHGVTHSECPPGSSLTKCIEVETTLHASRLELRGCYPSDTLVSMSSGARVLGRATAILLGVALQDELRSLRS
jgi:hypothetical protein